MSATTICSRCVGCGLIANTDEGEPWTYWENLPVKSAAAVVMGIVKAVPCPACGGTGTPLNMATIGRLYLAAKEHATCLAIQSESLVGTREERRQYDALKALLAEARTAAPA